MTVVVAVAMGNDQSKTTSTEHAEHLVQGKTLVETFVSSAKTTAISSDKVYEKYLKLDTVNLKRFS